MCSVAKPRPQLLLFAYGEDDGVDDDGDGGDDDGGDDDVMMMASL